MVPIQDIELDEPVLCPEGIDPALWARWQDVEEVKKDHYLFQLKQGARGLNVGLDNGLTNINKYIHGTHQGRYYLIGAESSAGKTTIGDFMYVLKAWESAKKMKRPIKLYYLSFEIGKTEKLYRWTSYYIFIKHSVRLPSDYLQGRINGKLLSKEHQQWVLEAYSIIMEMLKDIIIVQDVVHPTKIFEDLIETHFSSHGTVIRADVSEADKKKGKKGYVKGYVSNNPELITILVVDHLALTGTEMGLDTKAIMDKLSRYCIVLRNLFHCTIAIFQQFSTDMMATYRGLAGKKSETTVIPQRIDFGDSKATFRDADIVYGLVKPQRDMAKFHGYDISVMGLADCFVAMYLMKNRYGPSNRMLPLFMDGLTGCIYDLPLEPNNLLAMEKWHNQTTEIENVCQQFLPTS